MKMKRIFVLTLFFLLIYHSSHAMQITGGKIIDVVVADSGHTDSTFVTQLEEGWLSNGPNSFDVDKESNIYVLDKLGAKVQKRDRNGKWISSFPIRIQPQEQGNNEIPLAYEVEVDNQGNIYITGSLIKVFIGQKMVTRKGILKFSPGGNVVLRLPSLMNIRRGELSYGAKGYVLTDKDCKIYNFNDGLWGGIDVFSPDGDLEAHMYGKGLYESDYHDMGIVQREAGNDIYFRHDKYLMKTSLEDYVRNGRIDTVAVLPYWLRLPRFVDNKENEFGLSEYPSILIGFDRNSNFYFLRTEDWCSSKLLGICLRHRIFKLHLENGKLTETGKVEIDFQKGKEECSDKELWDFTKRFIVKGDGTIYWLHGTVDTVKVSKIIMD